MNSLQSELDKINAQLELLTYRKQQLDSIMAEYSDVVNRVKNLIDSMQDAMVEPSNLLMEIEGIIHGEPELTPIENLIKEQSEHIEEQPTVEPLYGVDCSMFDDDDEPEPTPEPTPQPTPQPETSNPELVKLMALVPTVATEQTPIKTQLNERAWQRNNTLLIGFPNKKLLKIWSKWFIENWGDSLFISDDSLEEFSHCLSVLWYKNANWERLKALDYSQSPDNQELIKTPDFEFKKATETTTQIFRDGVLLGLAKNCDGHWESPQFKGEQFDLIQDIADRMWELINQF